MPHESFDLTLAEINEILKLIGATVIPLLIFIVKRWLKLEKDINTAHARIRELQKPKCEVVTCPLTKPKL